MPPYTPADRAWRSPELSPEPGTPLYVHVPFCLAKCTYCDFFSLPAEGQDLPGTIDALLTEAERRAPIHPRTVFLGGGTPSHYSVSELARLLDGLDRWSRFRSSAVEVTCECNPESLDKEKALALRELGVDRLSIGFQSLDPRILELFGRVHSVRDSLAAFEAGRAAGFERISVDLIYGSPGQKLSVWMEEIDRIASLRPDHVSAYQLTYEDGTPMTARMELGSIQRLSEDEELAFFEATQERLALHGYEAYEISNFSLSDQQCLHNINYWRNGPYVGIGPSAVSKIGSTRFGNTRHLGNWRSSIQGGHFPAAWEETLPPMAQLGETWWLGLRTRAGVSAEEARQIAHHDQAGDPAELVARSLAASGFLELRDERFRLTARGWPVADAVARRFLQACTETARPRE